MDLDAKIVSAKPDVGNKNAVVFANGYTFYD